MIFFEHLVRYPFLQLALAAGILAAVACGVVGSYIVVRRSTYIAGAISHCVLGGMGLARYLQVVHHIEWLTPLTGATAAALTAGLIIGVVTLYGRQRVDTVLSAVWALGMAIGISFITMTPGYSQDLMSYLFGSILMVTPRDLWLMVTLNVIIVGVTLLFYNKFLAICFHEELARLRGIRTGAFTMLLLVMTALTVVLLVQIVGIVLVIALLTLPAATAAHLTKRLSSMMVLAAILTLVFTIGGLAISYQPQLPVSATIIEVAGGVYLLVVGGSFAWRRLGSR
jgi:zinc transport system permease protein